MKKFEALGVVETQYFTIAMELLDGMCKSSDVEFLTNENYLGGRLVTLIVGGSISDVTVAVDAAKQIAEGKENNPLKMALVITNPHAEILKYIIPLVQERESTIPEESNPNEDTKRKTRGRPKKTEDHNE